MKLLDMTPLVNLAALFNAFVAATSLKVSCGGKS